MNKAMAFKLFLSQLYRALLRHLEGREGGPFPLLIRSAFSAVCVGCVCRATAGVVQVILYTTPGGTVRIVHYGNGLP